MPIDTPSGGGAFVSGDKVSGDKVAGDFVGRDQAVFLGRDIPTEQVINISDVRDSTITIYPDTTIGRIGAQINRLRGRVTRLIPAEDALLKLAKLREPKRIGRWKIEEVELSLVGVTTRFRPARKRESDNENSTAEKYLDQLNDIEAQIVPSIEPEMYSQLLQNLSGIWDEVNIRIAKLNSLFTSIVYPATSSREFAENMVSKIGHEEFRDEANMHLGIIGQLVQKLDAERLTRPDLDVLSDEAYGAIGLMTELEKRRLVVERLVQSDRNRRNWTIASVIAYICVAIALTVFLIMRWGVQSSLGQVPLSQLRIPVLGIPWPVLVWSLIGSFAAMIYRFNANPIYDFTDTVKWMITRPIQGTVLGSTLYLILVSGLLILTAGNASDPAGLISIDEVILVLCFLVGFSDRFADSVFDTLVRRYSPNSTDQQPENK